MLAGTSVEELEKGIGELPMNDFRAALIFACVLGYAFASAGSCVFFKLAAQNAGKTAIWYFVSGNVIGALCPIALTLALRGTSPSIIYALCFGGAFALVQLVTWHLFQEPLSSWQWTGIVMVGLGILMLQIRG
jgi:multidrug transporter EmrE-like cation transporter